VFATAADMHASPAEAGVHLPVARAAATWVPASAGTADRSQFHAPRVGDTGGELSRNYPTDGVIARRRGRRGNLVRGRSRGPRLLRFARNDTLWFHAPRVGDAGGELARNKVACQCR
jgi:hypothetical protein